MKTVDLFCGCGGMSLGFINAGFNIVSAYDNWKPAVDIYKENFNHEIFNMNLAEDSAIDHIAKRMPEVIIGGPPCQDFSIAGHMNFKSERANLSVVFSKIVEKINPEWVVMENVYNIERSDVLPRVIRVLKDAGYGITKRVLNATYLGVPQARKRFFLVGHKNSEDGFLDAIFDRRISKKKTTVYDYLGDSLRTEYYYMHPRSYNRRAVFSIHEPSSTIRGVNRPIPKTYKKHPADKTDISAGVRALTTRERSLLQTFPKDFILVGSKTKIEQAIGNAVPVKMAEFVAKCIMEYISQSGRP